MFLDLVMGRKSQIGLTLSSNAVSVLDELAKQTESSRSEIIEAIAHAKLAIVADAPERVFHISHGDDQTIVEEVDAPRDEKSSEPTATSQSSQETPSTPAEHQPKAEPTLPKSAVNETVNRLEQEKAALQNQSAQEKATLQDQLAKTQADLAQIKSQLQQSQAQQSEASAPAQPSFTAANVDVTAQLREQLLNVKSALADLKDQHEQQQAENARLQQALAEAQMAATIGESQLKRWQYKTFSR